MKKTLQLQGLDCAACAGELEELISEIEGIDECSVTFMTQKLSLVYQTEEALQKAVDAANHFEEVKVVSETPMPENNAKNSGDMKIIKIQNLHCAACAMELQEELAKIKGVKEVAVDFISQTIAVNTSDESALYKVIKAANHFEKVKVVNEESVAPKKESHKKEIVCIAVSLVLFLAGLACEWWGRTLATDIVSYVLYALAYLVVGYPVLISTAKNIAKGKIFDENFLMTIASIGAMFLLEFSEAVEVMLLYQTGELLQSIAVGSSRRSITSLMALRSESANLLMPDGRQVVVKPEELKVGDSILVKAGEKIPVDAVITEGTTSLDTKSMTGESALREAGVGSEVLSGYINVGGNVRLRVERAYTDSAVAKILDMVENSASQKAKPEKFITRFAKYYTPVVCILALCIALFVPIIVGLVTDVYPWVEWIQKALVLLVISCPCALIISIPLTYFGGIGCAAKYGILVKGATYLDEAAKVKIAAFDKTGTLTEGDFSIVNVKGDAETLLLAAAAESGSSHPLAKPFASVNTPYEAKKVYEVPGKGVRCKIDGDEVLVGNAALLKEEKVSFSPVNSVSTVVYVARAGEFKGYIEIDDRIKSNATEALKALKAVGVERCVMVTGDNPARAESVAAELGEINNVYAGLLPDQKLSTVEALKREGKLLYVGDGINDAPVMTIADCAFSMGKLGSGAAIEASDFVLVSDNLLSVSKSIKIARKTKKIVLENLIFSIVAKVTFMVLGIVIELPLALAVLGDVGVMLLAVLNSMRMRLKIK